MSLLNLRVVVAVSCLALIAAAVPSDGFNVNGQKRTRTAAAMKGARVPLRFADGTASGFFARIDDPSKNGDCGKPCAAGFMEIDAQEIITTANGLHLLFH